MLAIRVSVSIAGAALGAIAMAAPLLAQCPDGTPPPCGARAAAPAARSVAVLTFENVTRDTSAQYLAEGLADQIATRLGGVARLTMVSRSSVRRLRNPEQLSIQQIGRTLSAAYLVNGSIRAAGGRVRVNVEAVRVQSGEAVWSQAFDRAGSDLIGIEEAVATEVASGVAGRLSPEERRVLGSRVTGDSRAYEQFVRGNVLLARRSREAMRDAITAYQAATAADPGFADAYGRLAYAYALCEMWVCRPAGDSLLGLSRDAAARALRLNPRSSDAWMGRAFLLTQWAAEDQGHGDDSLLASLAAFRHAVDLNPRNDEAWHQYGWTLGQVGDTVAIDALRRALALDPARAITYADLSLVYEHSGRNDRALATIDSAVALDPGGPFRAYRASYRLTAGDTAGAVADARLTPGVMASNAILAALARDSAAARAMEAAVAHAGCYNPFAAMYQLWTGQREQLVQGLVRCRPSLTLSSQLRWQALAPLMEDPRVRALREESDRMQARARWQGAGR
jgi:TolB-like protein